MTNLPDFTENRKKGEEMESRLIEICSDYVGERLFPTSPYYIIDWEGERVIAELKTRFCESTKYTDTMIGMAKIEYMLEMVKHGHKQAFIFFMFADGLFAFEVNEESVNHCRINAMGGRFDRGHDERRPSGYCYIPSALLAKVDFHQQKTDP